MGVMERRQAIIAAQDGFIPPEYRKVEYLESSGSQAINTGIAPSDDLESIAVISLTNSALTNNRNYVWGVSGGTGRIQFSYSPSTYFAWGGTGGSSSTLSGVDTNKHTAVINSRNFKIDDTVVYTPVNHDFGTGYTIYMFARSSSGVITDLSSGLRIYKCSFSKGGKLIRNLIPCVRRSDNKPGMYDTVNNTFYVSVGATDFIAGN